MTTHLSRRTVGAVALASCTALLIGACGGGAAADGDTGPLSVGYFPLVHTATAVQAEESGAFAAEGLEVELTQTAGGAQAIPSLIAGEHDITYGNYTSAILAAQQGLPIRIISGNDVGANDHGIMVNGDSPLQGPADLAGRSVAVNNLQNIGTVAVEAVVEEAGADPESIRFVELPYPDMAAALDRGDVDAIWQVEPFQARAVAGGDRVLFPLFSGAAADMPVAGWLTTAQFAEQNPEAVAGFARAISAAATELTGDRDRLVQLVPTYTQVPAEVVQAVELPRWEAELRGPQLQRIADLMQQSGIIDEPFDATAMLVSPA